MCLKDLIYKSDCKLITITSKMLEPAEDSNNQTGNYTLNEALGYMSWIGLESTNGYINNIESDTIKLNKKNYIESVARTKFTNNCQ